MTEEKNFEDKNIKEKFWHSSAHVLGAAILRYLPDAKLSHGPPIEEGFFYDFLTTNPISPEDLQEIEKICQEIIKENNLIEQEFWTHKKVKDFYEENKFKTHFLPNEATISIFKIKEFYDMCEGPHIKSTGLIKAFKLIKNSSSYFLGNKENETLQRIYGISFPTKKMMNEYEKRIKDAMERDHRKIGMELDLFFFDQLSPGSAFFLPDGAIFYNRLVNLLREEYLKRGYKEVITPNIFDIQLWKESGHYDNYQENMFLIKEGESLMGLKPMNCPAHCLIFRKSEISYKDLPLRMADFGVLHRNELKGSLSGLTRVRRFQQDDAHIFCTLEQVKEEVMDCLSFLDSMYKIFNFSYELKLSTRPEKFLGEISLWDVAETELKNLLQNYNYEINEKDGAFYGPKIDVILKDALNRKHQCGTIQLDFQLPLRFNLKYKDKEGYKTPIIIHRAIFGSLERFIAILLENYGKNLPFFLTPKQVAIIKINSQLIEEDDGINDYIKSIKNQLLDYQVKVFDEENTSLNKKIRNSVLKGYKIILVIGKGEMNNNKINLRNENKNYEIGIEDLKEYLKRMVDEKKDFGFSLK